MSRTESPSHVEPQGYKFGTVKESAMRFVGIYHHWLHLSINRMDLAEASNVSSLASLLHQMTDLVAASARSKSITSCPPMPARVEGEAQAPKLPGLSGQKRRKIRTEGTADKKIEADKTREQ
ncbi:Sphingosine kinase A [Frankliniella fusca]|uniref:Sphingosine kinase A n=1 Tax=Frankliniella fusca TaxID=407009 RepID=A0AAE1GT56_9NEOP|nr:Sphingosine kinase A [Frankliniella fusca]